MSTFDELIRDLQRDAQRVQPRDALQYCASWFQQRLEEQRNRLRDAAAAVSGGSFGLPADHIRDTSAWGGNKSIGGPGATNGWNPDSRGGSASSAAALPGNLSSLETFTLSPAPAPAAQSSIYSEHVSPFGTLHLADHPPGPGPRTRVGLGSGLLHPGRRSPFVPIPEESPSSFNNSIDPLAPAPPFKSLPPRIPSYSNLRGETGPSSSSWNDQPADFGLPPPHTFNRRTSISAESIIPNSTAANRPLPVHPKTPEQLERIRASISGNFIFRDLDPENETEVLNAMQEVKIGANEAIIRQGDDGEYFYVVEEGLLHCYVKQDSAVNTITSASSGSHLMPSGYHPEFGKKVAECRPGNSFGELALMYGHPRAATVLSIEPCTLWSLDRMTFRTIILKAAHKRRTMYEHFLSTVPLLNSLTPEERSKIADALMSRVCADGDAVVEQGEMGDAFFIIEEGEALVTKRMQDDSGEWIEQQVGHLKRGDYFGELSLLRLSPRAATVRAIVRTNPTEARTQGSEVPPQPKLKVAALGAPAFTRLLGSITEIMERRAGEYPGYKR